MEGNGENADVVERAYRKVLEVIQISIKLSCIKYLQIMDRFQSFGMQRQRIVSSVRNEPEREQSMQKANKKGEDFETLDRVPK